MAVIAPAWLWSRHRSTHAEYFDQLMWTAQPAELKIKVKIKLFEDFVYDKTYKCSQPSPIMSLHHIHIHTILSHMRMVTTTRPYCTYRRRTIISKITSNPCVVKLSWLANAYSPQFYPSVIWTSTVGQGDIVFYVWSGFASGSVRARLQVSVYSSYNLCRPGYPKIWLVDFAPCAAGK